MRMRPNLASQSSAPRVTKPPTDPPGGLGHRSRGGSRSLKFFVVLVLWLVLVAISLVGIRLTATRTSFNFNPSLWASRHMTGNFSNYFLLPPNLLPGDE